jgi:hypothetical protein
MSKGIGSSNGKDRRSGKERRKVERRDPKRSGGKGILTTRAADRRKTTRRKAEPEKVEPEDEV